MPRPANALEEGSDAPRGTDLAGQIHVTDVDPELERCGRHESLELSILEAGLRVESDFLRQTPMMRRDRVLTEPLGQMPGDSLRHPPCVDEDKGRSVSLDEIGEPFIYLGPDVGRHHGLERRARQLERQVEGAAMPFVDHRHVARRLRCSDEPVRDLFDRSHRGRQSDSLHGLPCNMREALEAQRQMRPTARLDHRVDLVHDHRADTAEHLAAPL